MADVELRRVGGTGTALQLLASKRPGVAKNAALLFATVTLDDDICLQLLREDRAVELMARYLRRSTLRLHLTRALANLADFMVRADTADFYALFLPDVTETLCSQLFQATDELLELTVFALGNLMHGSAAVTQRARELGVPSRFVELMGSREPAESHNAAAVVAKYVQNGANVPEVRALGAMRVALDALRAMLASAGDHTLLAPATFCLWPEQARDPVPRFFENLEAEAKNRGLDPLAVMDERRRVRTRAANAKATSVAQLYSRGYQSPRSDDLDDRDTGTSAESLLQIILHLTTDAEETALELKGQRGVQIMMALLAVPSLEIKSMALMCIANCLHTSHAHPEDGCATLHLMRLEATGGKAGHSVRSISPRVPWTRRQPTAMAMARAVRARHRRGPLPIYDATPDAQHAAAVKVQTQLRMHWARGTLATKQRRHAAAIRIQALVRMFLEYHRVHHLRTEVATSAGVMVVVKGSGTVQGRSGWYVTPQGAIYNIKVEPRASGAMHFRTRVGPVTRETYDDLRARASEAGAVAIACPGTTPGESGCYLDRAGRVSEWVVNSATNEWIPAD